MKEVLPGRSFLKPRNVRPDKVNGNIQSQDRRTQDRNARRPFLSHRPQSSNRSYQEVGPSSHIPNLSVIFLSRVRNRSRIFLGKQLPDPFVFLQPKLVKPLLERFAEFRIVFVVAADKLLRNLQMLNTDSDPFDHTAKEIPKTGRSIGINDGNVEERTGICGPWIPMTRRDRPLLASTGIDRAISACRAWLW